jgi:chorismate synthase
VSGNSFGHLLRMTSWGESHGPAIGCVLDGVPPRIPLTERDIQPWLDRRRPAQSRFTTQRKEEDRVTILSGTFEGLTTGTPISLLIENQDQRSKDYGEIQHQFRPGHADYTYHMKYGIRDHRGGGRSSARETAMRVASGAIARKILGPEVIIRAALIQMGEIHINRTHWDWNHIEQNPFWCPDSHAAAQMEDYLDTIRKEGSSVGAMIEIVVSGIPAGLGAPVYDKLDADIAKAIMSINAVKAVEIGDGMRVASLRGEQNADSLYCDESGTVSFASNHAGGILGGISSGQELIVRFAIKPTSSMLIPVPSINNRYEPVMVRTKGRHDPCVGIRAVPVAEAMMALVLADHYLRHKAQCMV